jgi:hypothetical protein
MDPDGDGPNAVMAIKCSVSTCSGPDAGMAMVRMEISVSTCSAACARLKLSDPSMRSLPEPSAALRMAGSSPAPPADGGGASSSTRCVSVCQDMAGVRDGRIRSPAAVWRCVGREWWS